MHEVNVDSIRVSLVNYQRVVILKDKTSGKSIPIWIGSAEADSIAVKLKGVSVPRPLPHDLMKMESETLVRVAVIEFPDQTTKIIPRANLEVILSD